MRILVLSSKMPYPSIDGGSIATLNLSQALHQEGAEINLLSMNTRKHYFPPEDIPQDIRTILNLQTVAVPAKINAWAAVKNLLFSKQAYTAERFYDDVFKAKLKEILQKQNFDIIQLEGLYLGLYIPFIRTFSKAKIVYRAHNLEFEIWQRAANRSSALKKQYFLNLSKRLLKLEKKVLKWVDAVVPISAKDGEWFVKQNPGLQMHIAPAGISRLFEKPNKQTNSEIDLFFIGALDWLPNQEGLLWFVEEVWPEIHQKHPQLKFYVAGRNASAQMQKIKAPNMVFLGEVEDAHLFMQQHAIMVVPLFSGSGMRIKIIEAMALKKALITTALGLEGNAASAPKQVRIANTKSEFIHQVDYLLTHPEEIQKTGEAASDFVFAHFNQQRIAQKLLQFYMQLIN